MALSVYPKAGMVVACNFHGYVEPEMIKVRPVVVISPNHLRRPGLCTIIPLSTTAPDPIEPYHYKLAASPFPHEPELAWAKCDMVATVSVLRLDRVKLGRGKYQIYYVSMDTVRAMRRCACLSFGIDL
jgi:uncharacterized protein YifN (PemK superfamily)